MELNIGWGNVGGSRMKRKKGRGFTRTPTISRSQVLYDPIKESAERYRKKHKGGGLPGFQR